jgi:geranylgeranyl reductase family protein
MADCSFDLAVIGAGPAGSSAARRAALLGLKVLLLDKHVMPRMKLCGGALSEPALRHLGFELPAELVDGQCCGARVHYRQYTSTVRLGRRVAVLVSREDFDALLVEKARQAGAVYEIGNVRGLTRDSGSVLITTGECEYAAAVAIIAQGASGNLIRRVRRPDGRRASGICIACRIPVSAPDPFAEMRDLLDIYFGVARGGYGWLFHHGRYCSVGIGALRANVRRPVEVFRTFCISLGLDPPAQHLVGGHPVPRGGLRRVLVGERMLLAGDAAGFVDPFCGEGLVYAIRSGQIAAEVAARAIRENDLRAANLLEYERRCETEFGRNLRSAARLARLTHACPWLFLRLLAGSPRVLRRYLEVPLSACSYRDFLLWLVGDAPRAFLRDIVLRPDSRPAESRQA